MKQHLFILLFFTEAWCFSGGAPCGGTLNQSRGEFFSPSYPNNYPDYANCKWSLMAGELQVVSLNFMFVDLESCCDFIHMYDGPTTQHSLLGSVTGNQRATFNSSTRYMTVVFSTDGSVTQQGFRAEWAFKLSSKQQIIKMKIQSSQDLNDPAVNVAILEKIKQNLEDNGMVEGIKVKWRVQSDGEVFHEEK
ncbi:CUB and zona pellucida-like domain-containing protein 1 isoform X2 [Ictalurus punctatus]|uniref:CUB and zona pellucida-like domain-containing protein 1 isoform X2 n=1 Tax=Ictalurus punctatus TaxID=7998 RepID=A0A2D0RQ37_ICTPU|nr:CUB and zona pellucida-like domain-containing protein 1 isoform X2 [Ictalurus punctatus]